MNFSLVAYILGVLLVVLAAMLLLPIPFAIYFHDGQILTFVLSSAIAFLVGAGMVRLFRRQEEVTHREGFAIVTFGWVIYALFGALPYLIAGTFTNPVDAYFESMAGFATVGSSVLTDIEAVPKSVLFWRATTQWIGGMGFIVLGLAILPLLGVGGMQLYSAEAPGPPGDRLTPRIQSTARLLWSVYAIVTAVGVVLLWVGEMNFFDSICHAFAAIATGGFSTRNTSLAAFGVYSQWIIILLMVMGGANFALHYQALRGRLSSYWINEESRFYLLLTVGAILIVFIWNAQIEDNAWTNLHHAAFTVTSTVSTTGFANTDYELWPAESQGIIFALTFIGGCAGSTAGGIKNVRVVLLIKHAYYQVLRLVHPRQVLLVKLDHRPVTDDTMRDVLSMAVLFIGVFVLGSLLVASTGVDLITGASAVAACISTVGPGFGSVGPTNNFAHLPIFAKIVLTICMLFGRLEIFTVLTLCVPSLWKR